MKLNDFKTYYFDYEFKSDTSKLSKHFLLSWFFAFVFIVGYLIYFFLSDWSELSGYAAAIVIASALVLIIYGSNCCEREDRIRTKEYFDYLDSCNFDDTTLFNASKSPEYAEDSKQKIVEYLDARRPNWSIRHPELWSNAT